MKTTLLIFISCFCAIVATAQQPIWKNIIRTDSPTDGKIVADNFGRSIICGAFHNSFQLSPSGTTHVSEGETDVYVAKFTENGDFMWSFALGGKGFENAEHVATDFSGNSYVLFLHSDTVLVNLPNNEQKVLTTSYSGYFILKLDPNGAPIWAKAIVRSFPNIGSIRFLYVDPITENLYASGSFLGLLSFEGSTPQGNNSTGNSSDAFVVRIDPLNGDILEELTFGSGTGSESVNCLTSLKNGKMAFVADFLSDFLVSTTNGPVSLVNKGEEDLMIGSISTPLAIESVFSIGGESDERSYYIISDLNQNVIVTGTFGDSTRLNPMDNSQVLKSKSYSDLFVASYSLSGEQNWIKQFGDTLFVFPSSIGTNDMGSFVIGGEYRLFLNVDTNSTPPIVLNNQVYQNFFTLEMDYQGNVLDAFDLNCQDVTQGSVAADNMGGYVYFGGFRDSCAFNELEPTVYDLTDGPSDYFLFKTASVLAVHEKEDASFSEVYPNPTTGFVTLKSNELFNSVQLIDIQGRVVKTFGIPQTNELEIDVTDLKHGIYTVVCETINHDTILTRLIKTN